MSTPLDDLVSVLLDTRDFCGDENEALRQWQTDNGRKLSAAEIISVRRMVETLWRKSQLAAGVAFPLSTEERAKAFRDIDSGGK